MQALKIISRRKGNEECFTWGIRSDERRMGTFGEGGYVVYPRPTLVLISMRNHIRMGLPWREGKCQEKGIQTPSFVRFALLRSTFWLPTLQSTLSIIFHRGRIESYSCDSNGIRFILCFFVSSTRSSLFYYSWMHVAALQGVLVFGWELGICGKRRRRRGMDYDVSLVVIREGSASAVKRCYLGMLYPLLASITTYNFCTSGFCFICNTVPFHLQYVFPFAQLGARCFELRHSHTYLPTLSLN